MHEERRKEQIEENQCSTNDKAKYEESSRSQSLNENESCFMAIKELEVTSNSCDSTPYSFEELQDAYEKLAIELEKMNLKYKKMILKLNVENEFLMKIKIDLERQNEILKINFDDCQKKNTILKEKSLNLKMKFEELITEKQNVFNNPSHPKMTKCTHCSYHGHSINTRPIRRKIPYKFR